METEYKQKKDSLLTSEQLVAKRQKDKEYEQAVQALSKPFYDKKHSIGVTSEEEAQYREAKAALWGDYEAWAIADGLYYEFTPEMQLAEREDGINETLIEVNHIRKGMGLAEVEIKEKIRIQ